MARNNAEIRIKNRKIFNNNEKFVSGLLDKLDKKIENKNSKDLTRNSDAKFEIMRKLLLDRLNKKIKY
jgi:hypothetical protein